MVKKPLNYDFSCQIVHGREVNESNSSLKIDRNAGNDPYLRDQMIGAYTRDTGNQFKVSQKTESDETQDHNRRVQVSDDLTIQLNFNGDKSIKLVPKYDGM